MSEKKTREELAATVDLAEWQWVRPHCDRGVVITVAPGLDLAEVGERLAADDAAAVGSWIDSGEIGKPTAAEIDTWDLEPARKFPLLIVSPYILISKVIVQ